jgi:hypothetical protein
VLGLQTSHLFLIRTNLGYRTVLTAACARQGCSASVFSWCKDLVNWMMHPRSMFCLCLLLVVVLTRQRVNVVTEGQER